MNTLIETDEIKLRTLTKDGEALRLKVPVLASGVKNGNGRTYSLNVIKKAIAELKGRLAKRSTFGSTAHVEDMELDSVSHIVEDILLDEAGVAHAVLNILPTVKCKNLASILRGGGAVGISARGTGDVDKDGNVKENYRLLGVDFTLSPSFNFRADRSMVFESLKTEDDENTQAINEAKSYPSLEELDRAQANEAVELAEEVLHQRYDNAVRLAGFKGDFESYQKFCEKGLTK